MVPVQVSSRHPTLLASLQEMLKRLQDRHAEYAQAVAKAEKNADNAPNVMQTLILFHQAKDREKSRSRSRKSHGRSGEIRQQG